MKIIEEDEYGYIVDLTSLAYAPSGFAHSDSLSNVIKNQYGLTYVRDFNRSSVHLPGCQSGPLGTSIEIDMTYALEDGQTGGKPVKAPIDTTISVSFRRTFLKLEKVPQYRMRRHHPKSGFNSISYENDTESFLRPRDSHSVTRHMLKIVDPHSGLESSIYRSQDEMIEKQRGREREEDEEVNDMMGARAREGNAVLHVRVAGQEHIRHQTQNKNKNKNKDKNKDQALQTRVSSVMEPQHRIDPVAQHRIDPVAVHRIDPVAVHRIDPVALHGAHHDLMSPQPQESDAQLLYMVDCTAPLAVQRALVEGVRWWDEAFQYVSQYQSIEVELS